MAEPAFSSLADLLRYRADQQADKPAYTMLASNGSVERSLTFAALYSRAKAVADHLAAGGAKPSDRAILMFAPGLDFVEAFFGCMLGGIVAVPVMPPRRNSLRGSTFQIIADCAPRLVITSRMLAQGLRSEMTERLAASDARLVVIDDCPLHGAAERPAAGSDIAMLQYTSGSTSDPKGVIVAHRNLLANLEMARVALGNSDRSTCVSWVPFYHDMGLILNALQTMYVGASCVLLAPTAFVQRPLTWLRAIHQYRAEFACAPNFGYDLCVTRHNPEQVHGLDLSSWRVALNGAEPIRADTIDQFTRTFGAYGMRGSAMFPAYGLAEATVLVSAGRRGEVHRRKAVNKQRLRDNEIVPPQSDADATTLIGCGKSLPGQAIAIVDPQTCRRQPAGVLGEIWVAGPNVAGGYWKKPAQSLATFGATIDGEPERHWLRTGDLGFVDDDGELFITGRLKDVIIVHGANHYPQDIEHSAANSHPALHRNGGAAFVDENEAVVLVHEIERVGRHHLDLDEVVGSIREAIVHEHELSVRHVVLVKPGSLPKTTSGKVQRKLTRTYWLENRLDAI